MLYYSKQCNKEILTKNTTHFTTSGHFSNSLIWTQLYTKNNNTMQKIKIGDCHFQWISKGHLHLVSIQCGFAHNHITSIIYFLCVCPHNPLLRNPCWNQFSQRLLPKIIVCALNKGNLSIQGETDFKKGPLATKYTQNSNCKICNMLL